MLSKFKFMFVLALVSAVTTFVACGGSDATDEEGTGGAPSTGGEPSQAAELQVLFPKMYSAYDDGLHKFQLPAKVATEVGAVTWSFEPAELVTYEAAPEVGPGGIMITTKGVGTVKVTATANNGELLGTATLEISDATSADWELGNKRYNNAMSFPTADDFTEYVQEDGGLDAEGQAALDLIRTNKDWSCAECHSEGSEIGAVEHTPWQTAGYSDDDLIKLVTTGVKPAGAKYLLPEEFGLGAAAEILGPMIFRSFHTWEASPAEQKAIVTYLRSLTPTSQGELDFSSVMGIGGGFGG